MLKIRLKKRIVSTLLLGALLAAPLGLIPTAANASRITDVLVMGGSAWGDPSEPHQSFPQTSGDQGGNGLTDFDMGFASTEGIWLEMSASPNAPNETMDFILYNRTNSLLWGLTLEFRTPNGESLGLIADRPTKEQWAAAVYDPAGGLSVEVSTSRSQIYNGFDYQRVELAFDSPMAATINGQLQVYSNTGTASDAGFGSWTGFNPDGATWWLNINPDTFPDTDADIRPPPPVAAPIPGAVWLLGSALLGLVARSGRKRAG